MKKWLVILSFLLAVCALTACAKEDTDSTTLPTVTTAATTVPTESVTVDLPQGHIAVPEGVCTQDDLDSYDELRFEILDERGYTYVYAKSYSFATDTLVMYVNDSYYQQEVVNVVFREDVTRYTREYGEEDFILDEYADMDTYADDEQDFTSVLGSLVQFSKAEAGVSYRYLEDVEAPTGPACVYEAYYEGKLIGYLWLDKATGIMVRQLNQDKQLLVAVTGLSVEDAGIPKYK